MATSGNDNFTKKIEKNKIRTDIEDIKKLVDEAFLAKEIRMNAQEEKLFQIQNKKAEIKKFREKIKIMKMKANKKQKKTIDKKNEETENHFDTENEQLTEMIEDLQILENYSETINNDVKKKSEEYNLVVKKYADLIINYLQKERYWSKNDVITFNKLSDYESVHKFVEYHYNNFLKNEKKKESDTTILFRHPKELDYPPESSQPIKPKQTSPKNRK